MKRDTVIGLLSIAVLVGVMGYIFVFELNNTPGSVGASKFANADWDFDGIPNGMDDDLDGDGILNDEDDHAMYTEPFQISLAAGQTGGLNRELPFGAIAARAIGSWESTNPLLGTVDVELFIDGSSMASASGGPGLNYNLEAEFRDGARDLLIEGSAAQASQGGVLVGELQIDYDRY